MQEITFGESWVDKDNNFNFLLNSAMKKEAVEEGVSDQEWGDSESEEESRRC
jgi:hypothetical protein